MGRCPAIKGFGGGRKEKKVSNSFQDFTGSQYGDRPIRQKNAFSSLILVLVSTSAAAAAAVL